MLSEDKARIIKVLFIDNHRKMASSGDVAILNTVHTPFGKIHKLYRTANQKIVKNDVTEIKIDPPEVQVRVRVTAEYQMIDSPPPLPAPQKKKLKGKKHKKEKGLERKNNLVPMNETQLQPAHTPNLGGTLFMQYTPPIDWQVNVFLLYFGDIFKTLEKRINEKIKVD